MDALDRIAQLFGVIAMRAGDAIMNVRASAQHKDDGLPVTVADLEADQIIRSCPARTLPELSVVTEETCGSKLMASERRFVLVDPLDGTMEFIEGIPEYTVNIALIEDGMPLTGAVYAPALHDPYLGASSAYELHVESRPGWPSFSKMQAIQVRCPPPLGLRVVIRRSHLDEDTKAWLDRHALHELKPSGSSLKFCVIAEGEANVYPRLEPMMEWDTTAAAKIRASSCTLPSRHSIPRSSRFRCFTSARPGISERLSLSGMRRPSASAST